MYIDVRPTFIIPPLKWKESVGHYRHHNSTYNMNTCHIKNVNTCSSDSKIITYYSENWIKISVLQWTWKTRVRKYRKKNDKLFFVPTHKSATSRFSASFVSIFRKIRRTKSSTCQTWLMFRLKQQPNNISRSVTITTWSRTNTCA